MSVRPQLEAIFGRHIEMDTWGDGWGVKGMLDDGEFCKQAVRYELRLSKEMDVPGIGLQDYFGGRKLRGFRIESGSFEGEAQITTEDNCYVVPAFPTDPSQLSAEGQVNPASAVIEFEVVDPVDKVIILPVLKTPDDLATYFHGWGHAHDPELGTSFGETTQVLQKLLEEKGEAVVDDPEAGKLWRSLVEVERRADIIALKEIARRQATPDGKYLFEGDANLSGVSKLYQFLLWTSYLGLAGNRFADKLTKEELADVLRF